MVFRVQNQKGRSNLKQNNARVFFIGWAFWILQGVL